MCGIFAIICPAARRLPDDAPARLERALESIKHRGPDARGTHIDPSGRYALGHVRLSVIDLAPCSNQPFWSSCGRFVLSYNGEIFNYLELRAELEKEGATFRTASDTEVLLVAMMRWGPDAINRFNGMWSFVFGDTATGKFLVSRDRWGTKPLFTYQHNGSFILCSEAKGILAWLGSTPKPNPHAIGLYLKYGRVGANEESWFDGIERFPQASYQCIDMGSGDSGTVAMARTMRYWNYPTERPIRDLAEAKERMESLLTDAIKLRLRSDVPIGLSLSGGLDSAVIAGLVGSKFHLGLEAYTAWYEPREQSELPLAQSIAKLFGHKSTDVPEPSHEKLLLDLRTCIYHLDSAHSATAIVPYLNLCRAARKTLTVMLDGQGADELLGGYHPFKLFAGADHLMRGRFGSASQCVRAYAHSAGWRNVILDCLRFGSTSMYERQALRWGSQRILCRKSMDATPDRLDRLSLSRSNFREALEFSHSVNLTNLMQSGDAISMSVNLETRYPFLDYRIVELGFSLDTELLLQKGFGKYVLRECADEILPHKICWRRNKDGFGNSTARIIREIVQQHGLPAAAVERALDFQLFQPSIRDPKIFAQLPENIQFRLFSTLVWLDVFYN